MRDLARWSGMCSLVMPLLHELYMNGTTICIVTHDPRYARHADRHIYLFDGRVVDQLDLEAMAPSSAPMGIAAWCADMSVPGTPMLASPVT